MVLAKKCFIVQQGSSVLLCSTSLLIAYRYVKDRFRNYTGYDALSYSQYTRIFKAGHTKQFINWEGGQVSIARFPLYSKIPTN